MLTSAPDERRGCVHIKIARGLLPNGEEASDQGGGDGTRTRNPLLANNLPAVRPGSFVLALGHPAPLPGGGGRRRCCTPLLYWPQAPPVPGESQGRAESAAPSGVAAVLGL